MIKLQRNCRAGRWQGLFAGALLAIVGSAAQARGLTIGVVFSPDDARYATKLLEKSYPGHPLGRPKAGAEVAIAESDFQLANAGLKVTLQDVPLNNIQQARAQIVAMAQKGFRYFLLDLPGASVAELSRALQGTDVLLFNVSAPEDNLRRAACSANLFHALPDESMMADATAQFLTAHKWTKVLLLTSTVAADASRISATRQAIKRYGIKVVADKTFKLSNDPRERDLGNVALLTAGVDADAVWVVDADGEFARDVPYRTNLPRPVVGSAGLVAEAWQTSWERYGAPQLSRRFKKITNRPMAGADWAAWIATKAILEVALKVPDARQHRNALRSPDLALDGFKGARLSFRPWDQQLRQPVFLAHGGIGGGIAGVAPFDGFLHPTNNLDTLGADQKESPCNLSDSPAGGKK
ncbi:ABC transporter substrate-binding protein [Herminiimonas sp. CN]|uniref:ABC transporter substrate-binding protein n=1 Tax=Herminiimonas sp. CN TaxID=1349818 RepID=UPI000473A68A|nr:ABC transporter substrate-binding protein [Herminiimonas sp. CN]